MLKTGEYHLELNQGCMRDEQKRSFKYVIKISDFEKHNYLISVVRLKRLVSVFL